MGEADDDRDSLLSRKKEFFDSFFRKGAELTRELLAETDRLRRRIVGLEAELAAVSQPAPSQETLRELVAKLHQLEEERARLLARLADAEAIGSRFGSRVDDIERENNDLASLYVAQSQLHASLSVAGVVEVILEIGLNFVGAQRFAIYLLDREGDLRVLAAEGIDPDTLPAVAPGEAAIGRAFVTGQLHIDDDAPAARREPGRDQPSVCCPLRAGDQLIGVLAVWCFLRQKDEMTDLDRRLFELIASSGGHALEAARLASRARPPSGGHAGGSHEEYAALMGGR